MKSTENVCIEEMEIFFNQNADNYDAHMKNVVKSFDMFYKTLSEPIPPSHEKLKILDLGCGTGLEIKSIFEKVPHAKITGVDLSQNMLDKLKSKYEFFQSQLELIKGSYFHIPFPDNHYDYVLSGMTMHHFTYEEKLWLYKKIRNTLACDGAYIEGDYIESEEKESAMLEEYLSF